MKSFYKNAAAIILVFSYDKKDSLTALNAYLHDVIDFAGDEVPIFLVGNKSEEEV